LLEMTVPQTVSRRAGTFRPHYDAAVGKPPLPTEAFRGLLEMSHAPRLRERVRGFWRVLRNLRASS
jgi:hypothetical protein